MDDTSDKTPTAETANTPIISNEQKTPIVIIEEEAKTETSNQESMTEQKQPADQDHTNPSTPGNCQHNFYEDDASVGDFGEQNIMEDDEYESSASMNEMLNFVRGDHDVVDQLVSISTRYQNYHFL
jgi:hypothetical protein